MAQNRIELNEGSQSRFFLSKAPSVAVVAGFGSGKTYSAWLKIFHWMKMHPGVQHGYFAPTYGLIRDIFYPMVEQFCLEQGLQFTIKYGSNVVHIHGMGSVICRSMQNPETIVGFQIGHAAVDEIDILSSVKAWQAWRKIKARCRVKLYKPGKKKKRKNEIPNQMALASTPEGFRFAYEAFKQKPLPGSRLYTMSTYSNEANLPVGYIKELLSNYPAQLVDAYIHGHFTNLTQGTIYTMFDRVANHQKGRLKKGERLHIGMDFNVQNMSAVIHVIRGMQPIAVGEVTEIYDTPQMINTLNDLYRGHQKIIYPDASGRNRSTSNASISDLKLLRDPRTGMIVKVNNSNPRVKDRINSMNAMFCNGFGQRRYFVDTIECPQYTEYLEQQAYNDQGVPDKTSGLDHLPDAGGYFIEREFGLVKPSSQTAKLIM